MGKKSKRNRPAKNSAAAGQRRGDGQEQQQGGGGRGRGIVLANNNDDHGRDATAASNQTENEDLSRVKANYHKKMFNLFSGNHFLESRCHQFKLYCDTIGKEEFESSLTKDDYRFLRSMWKSTRTTDDECELVRAQAYYTRSIFKRRDMQFEDAEQCLVIAIQICQQGKKKQGRYPSTPVMVEYMNSLQNSCQKQLADWKTVSVGVDHGLLREVKMIGGDHCDACGKQKKKTPPSDDDDEHHFMKCCGRCRLAFYCSRECQQKHWNTQHQHQCRSPREFKVGDIAYYCGKTNKQLRCRQLVRLQEYTATKFPFWLVSWPRMVNRGQQDEDGSILNCWVEAKFIRRCRSGIWDACPPC